MLLHCPKFSTNHYVLDVEIHNECAHYELNSLLKYNKHFHGNTWILTTEGLLEEKWGNIEWSGRKWRNMTWQFLSPFITSQRECIDFVCETEVERCRLQTKTMIMLICVFLTADHGDVRWSPAGDGRHSFSCSAKKPSCFLLLLSMRPAVVCGELDKIRSRERGGTL